MPKLTEEEIDSVMYLVRKYSDLWVRSDDSSKKLESLNKERESLVTEIERLSSEMDIAKQEEKILDDKLKNKYGNIQLDMETFEFDIID